MTGSIKVRARLRGDVAEVKCLVKHPMHTGLRENPESGLIEPAHYVTQLVFAHNGRPVMTVNCSTAVARDPYFTFSFSGANAGDTLTVNWVDNQGQSDTAETVLARD